MKRESRYSGVVVPMITPVTPSGDIDTAAVERIINSFAEAGVHALIMGTTGEGNSVAPDQARIFVKAAVEAAAKRIVIYVGLSGCSTRHHIEMANEYHRLGADVIVPTLPGYYALTEEQMYRYYKTIADHVTAPVMLYNIKATTHMSIPVDVVAQLSRHPNIVGLKDSERDLERMAACLDIALHSDDFAYFLGWAAQSANALELGADGIVPSTGNFVPQMFRDLYEAGIGGDRETAQRLQAETDDVAKIYQADRTLGQSLAALKVMMGIKRLCGADMLSPLTRLTEAEEKAIVERTLALK